MKKFIFILVVLLLSVWLGLKISEDPGLAYFGWRDWSVEMPLWFALFALAVLVLLVYLVVRFLDSIDASFYHWKNWRRQRRREKAYSKTSRGLLELIEHHWRHAENDVLDGIDQSDAPIINYLAAAKAAHERGAFDKRDVYLRQAYDVAPKAEVAIGLTQAHLLLDQNHVEQALMTLTHLQKIAPAHPVVLKLLEKSYVRLSDWQKLLKLIPSLRKAQVCTAEQLDKLEQKVYQELINMTASKSYSLKDLQLIWKNMPRRLQKNPQVVFCYAKQLLLHPEMIPEVDELINKVLTHQWDADLAKLYGEFHMQDPRKQLAHAEKWLKYYPHQTALLLTLGKLSLNCQLWGKARGYFEDCLKFEASPAAYFEYAKLLEHLNEPALAMKNYREGLARLA